MESKTIIFVGRSGSGKGTQMELLQKYLSDKEQIPQKSLVMGEIYRAFFKDNGYMQDIARELSMSQGKFQPDFLTNALFVHGAVSLMDKDSDLFVDGYPRTISQLKTLKEILEYAKRIKAIVFNIEVPAEAVKTRMLLRKRGDDTEKAIESRLNEYEVNVVPMLEVLKTDPYFEYVEINGEPDVETIHKDIIKALGY